MERSGDRYLHKKFKKQLNIEPNPQTDEERAIALSTKINESLKNYRSFADSTEISSLRAESIESIPVINSNNGVPKVSTNSENTFNATVSDSSNVAKSSISQLSLTNIKEKGTSSREEAVDILESHPSNGCISFVISKSSRIENLNQPESHVSRAANFDMRFNVSEPIIIPTASTSSILNNVYPNHYVTSKLVNIDKIEDISSSSSLSNNDHLPRQEVETKIDNYAPDLVTSEKNSGGKYICSYCNLACSKPSVLQKHIRAHTNERPYPCVSCGFSFKTRSNLYKHCRSRTHANRVMGNKTQEINNDLESDSRTKLEYMDQNNSLEFGGEDFVNAQSNDALIDERNRNVDIKMKPYKPRFHTAKIFFDNVRDNEDQKISESIQNRPSNSDLLSLHINDVINKNNAIVNSNESFLLRKRTLEHNQIENANNNEFDYRHNELIYHHQNLDEKCTNEEPLNLTNKTRKRCLSEIAEPTMHTSLIKELLLKNLYADSMQCQHCKMIFQTVTELELHKMRSCKGFTKTGARYSRSSSVNVASILTKNKNAFDTIPHLQNNTFSLKSPGPFLGKTQLVESDKNKSFSFDDGLPNFPNNLQNPSDILRTSLRYSISPLTVKNDKTKKPSIKLFGGEVKITHTSGTIKNLKFDNREEDYVNYGGRLSENRVVKSGLQSGGTVLQNKQYYNNAKQDPHRSSPDVIRIYENTPVSPSIDLIGMEKSKLEFDRQNHDYQNQKFVSLSETTENSSYHTNIMDFSQKAVKMLAPNLKQLSLTIPGVLVPSMSTKTVSPCSPSLPLKIKPDFPKVFEVSDSIVSSSISKTQEPEIRHIENMQFAQKQILLHQKASSEHIQSPSNYNPVNLLVNGKVVRYVPGMPGPVAADVPPHNSNIGSTKLTYSGTTQSYIPSETGLHYSVNKTPEPKIPPRSTQLQIEKKHDYDSISKLPKFNELEVKTGDTSVKMTEAKPFSVKSIGSSGSEVSRKFVRPNTLALKPSIAFSKQHHGLTPTMFNQILISPDTPRVAKKYMQHFLHGNYFSYLGLKSSTKSVYCTLNKTQPFYVPHFKKLSMYSEWRQQDIKGDKLYVSAYDSRQKQQKYVTAGKATADFVVHSSYKFLTEASGKGEEHCKSSSIVGGYESNEDYTYIRGRGRGRYVCDQCGIRCKKPSMLKKHIRTHTNDRPFTCNHCNFSFKTKGNLTKHMKSKVHSKNHAASSSSNSSAHQSGTQSSESDTDDSGMDSSDESTRQQEHEAAYGLLSLSQKTTQNTSSSFHIENYQPSPNIPCSLEIHQIECQGGFMNTEQVTQVNNSNFAKNKILDHGITLNFNTTKIIDDVTSNTDLPSKQMQNVVQFLGKTYTSRPLTYPYTSDVTETEEKLVIEAETQIDQRNLSTFNIVQKHNVHYSPPGNFSNKTTIPITISYDSSYLNVSKNVETIISVPRQAAASPERSPIQFTNKVNTIYDIRKRKTEEVTENNCKLLRINSELEAMDLTMSSHIAKSVNSEVNILRCNGAVNNKEKDLRCNSLHKTEPTNNSSVNKGFSRNVECRNTVEESNFSDSSNSLGSNSLKLPYKLGNVDNNHKYNGTSYEINETRENENAINLKISIPHNGVDINYVVEDNQSSTITTFTEAQNTFSSMDYDNSAMETLADVATKQVKLEKNILAKTVASEYLKIATKYEFQNNDGIREISNFASSTKEVNELIVKPEENKNCTICAKNFSKPSQLRLHMNIHYLERPFRCDPCSVSFRTKGHLQKHERSASHHKLSSSPLLSSSEPRPFKCSDCNIAFRIHGHLAKHLRSKMHIMKLECLAKIPFGLYAELERANSLLTEINTTDGDQCLESLKALARKVFINDPSKLNQLQISLSNTDTSDS